MQSVDGSTSQSRPSREKRRSSSCSSLSLSSAARHKAGNLSSRGTPDGTSREVRKISLVSYQSLKWQKRRVPHVTKARADLEYGSHRDSPKGCQRLSLHPRALARDPGLCPEDNGRRGAQEPSPGPRTHCKSSKGTLLVRLVYHVIRLSAAGPSHVAVSKAPQKAQGPYRSTPLKTGVQSDRNRDTESTPVASLRSSSLKTVVLKTRLLAKPPGDTGQPLSTSCKSTSSSKGGPARNTVTPPRRTVSSRIGSASLKFT
ncbi:hypothetical protein CRUP_029039, partial [Coryphaenoides rupestris]